MKPPPFQYHRPKTLEETLALLKRLDNCCLLAGGQSLVPMLNFRLLYPNDLIDLNGVAQLAGISITDGQIRFGAMNFASDSLSCTIAWLASPRYSERLSSRSVTGKRATAAP